MSGASWQYCVHRLMKNNSRPGYLGAVSIYIKSQFLWLQIHHDWKTTEDEWLCIHFLKGKNVHRVFTSKRKVKWQLLKKTLKSDKNKGQQKEAMTWQLSWSGFKPMLYRLMAFTHDLINQLLLLPCVSTLNAKTAHPHEETLCQSTD